MKVNWVLSSCTIFALAVSVNFCRVCKEKHAVWCRVCDVAAAATLELDSSTRSQWTSRQASGERVVSTKSLARVFPPRSCSSMSSTGLPIRCRLAAAVAPIPRG